MIRFLALGLSFGLGVGMARNEPSAVHAQPGVFVMFLGVAVVLAFFAGRSRRASSSSSTAVAVSRSESKASADSRVNVVVVADGARAAAARHFGGLDRAEWVGGVAGAAGVDPELFDHFDPAEVRDAADAGELLSVPVGDDEAES